MAHSILVVDDDPHIRDVVRFAFEKTGMAISIAQDGKEALARFDRNVHDLIVLDIGMPEMDGLEATRIIRDLLPAEQQPRIIAMTANVMKEDQDACAAAGMDDYLSKPIQVDALMAALVAYRSVPAQRATFGLTTVIGPDGSCPRMPSTALAAASPPPTIRTPAALIVPPLPGSNGWSRVA